MILVMALGIALASAAIKPGRLTALAVVKIRGIWLLAAIILLQLWAIEIMPEFWLGHAGPLLVSTQMLLAFILWVNRPLPGFRLLLIGALLNLVVMATNGGYMPVSREVLANVGHDNRIRPVGEQQYVPSTKDIVLDPGSTALYPLSDIFFLDWHAPLRGYFSIGDALIALGITVFLHRAGGGKNDLPEIRSILNQRGRPRLLQNPK